MLLLPRKVNILANLHGTDVALDNFGVGKTRTSSLFSTVFKRSCGSVYWSHSRCSALFLSDLLGHSYWFPPIVNDSG